MLSEWRFNIDFLILLDLFNILIWMYIRVVSWKVKKSYGTVLYGIRDK